jgi:hypothetical protein
VLPKVDVERLLAEDKDRDRGKDSREPLPLRYVSAEYLPAQGSMLQPSSSGQRIHIVRE